MGIDFWAPLALMLSVAAAVLAASISSLLHPPQTGIGSLADLPEAADEITHLYDSGHTRQGIPVGDDEFRAAMLFWTDPCIDTTYYALDTFRVLLADQPDALRDSICGMRNALRQMVRDHFDEEYGAFKHHPDSWPSLYASLLACRLSSWLVDPGSFVGPNGHSSGHCLDALSECLGQNGRAGARLAQFARACEHEDGGFGEFPGAEPGTITTDAGYLLLRMLGESPRSVQSVVDFIWSTYKPDPPDDGNSDESAWGFANRPTDEPTCSATRFAVRSLEEHEELKALGGLDDQHRWQVIRFLQELQSKEDGGFALAKNEPPCPVQTSLAVMTLQFLSTKLGQDFGEAMPYEPLASYVRLLSARGHRFGFLPSSPPNIHVVRAVAYLVRTMEEVYPGNFRVDQGFRERIINAVWQHSDETGLFVGYAHDGRSLASRSRSIAHR